MKYPLSDELMIYDFKEHRYILKSKDILDTLGENLNVRLNKKGSNNVENVVNSFLDQISLEIYNEIYKCNINNKAQQFVIAKSETARDVLKKAMEQQVLYVMSNGDLNMFSGVDIRKGQVMQEFTQRTISPLARQILSTLIPEVGYSLLFTGFIYICPPSYEKGGY